MRSVERILVRKNRGRIVVSASVDFSNQLLELRRGFNAVVVLVKLELKLNRQRHKKPSARSVIAQKLGQTVIFHCFTSNFQNSFTNIICF